MSHENIINLVGALAIITTLVVIHLIACICDEGFEDGIIKFIVTLGIFILTALVLVIIFIIFFFIYAKIFGL